MCRTLYLSFHGLWQNYSKRLWFKGVKGCLGWLISNTDTTVASTQQYFTIKLITKHKHDAVDCYPHPSIHHLSIWWFKDSLIKHHRTQHYRMYNNGWAKESNPWCYSLLYSAQQSIKLKKQQDFSLKTWSSLSICNSFLSILILCYR